jgi:flagellar hook protein FlgE
VSNGAQSFTRDGALTVDAAGHLATATGGLVQGWQANGAGVVANNQPIAPITIPQGETIGANQTTKLVLGGNLPAWSGTGTAPVQTTTIDAYDALGNQVPVTLTFTGVTGTANQWTVQGTVKNPDGTTTQLWTTPPTIAFNPTTGQVTSVTGGTADPTNPAITDLAVNTMPTGHGFNFPATDTWMFQFPAAGSSGAVTQYQSGSTIGVTSQDGYASGALQSFSIGSDGTISGAFSNGKTLAIGQIALANFANPGGLTDQGGGLFAQSANSGQPQVGVPGSGGRGSLIGGALEQSNVNLGKQLTDLINAQEAYVGNTKTLATDQQMVQSLESVA